MKQGKTLQSLAEELERQKTLKRDFGTTTANITMDPEMQMHLGNSDREIPPMAVTDFAHQQIGQKVGMPKAWYDKLRQRYPQLLAHDLNFLFRENSEPRMIRTMDNRVRGFVSNRYRPLDNADLAEIALPKIAEMDCKVVSCEITETRMYIKAVSQRLTDRAILGEVVQQGVVISNSEVGDGALRIESLLFRLVCLNGMISGQKIRKAHLGRRNPFGDIDNNVEYLSDATRRLDDAAFWAKAKDAMGYILSQKHLDESLVAVKAAKDMVIDAPPQRTVELLGSKIGLSENERESVLHHLVKGQDLSAWGYTNAVTRMSQDVASYDRATEIERLGGKVVELAPQDWNMIAKRANREAALASSR